MTAHTNIQANGQLDYLYFDSGATLEWNQLKEWAASVPGLVDNPYLDYHRLQLEHWVWRNRRRLQGRVMDVGVYFPRRWIGKGYFTFGEHEEDEKGDILALPYDDDSIDAVVCTEVLEHVPNPFTATNEIYRVLKPGGLLLVTSPFLWPWHGIEGQYKDYWRFTDEGWRELLKQFNRVKVEACKWSTDGLLGYHIMRKFECMGFDSFTRATTGYLCEATK